MAEIYDKTRSLPNDVMERLVSMLASELSGCKTVLDIGVGTGRFAEPLQNAGFGVVGIDIAKEMMRKAKGKGLKNLIRGDARLLPFRDLTFDATISVHLLHLIKNWQHALLEICRVTQNFLVSLFYVKKDPVSEAYDLVLRRYGYERRRLGKSEQELKEIVTPAKSVPVTSYSTSSDDRLTNLAQGTSSSQWEIPTEVNQKVVEELRGQFKGKIFTQELRILMWRIDELKAYFEKVNV